MFPRITLIYCIRGLSKVQMVSVTSINILSICLGFDFQAKRNKFRIVQTNLTSSIIDTPRAVITPAFINFVNPTTTGPPVLLDYLMIQMEFNI